MDNTDPLSLDFYAIEVAHHTGLMQLNFKDKNGNVVLMTRQTKLLGGVNSIETTDGKILGTIKHRTFGLTPGYELHDGDEKGKIIGSIKVKLELLMQPGTLREVDIKDLDENIIGVANGNFMGMEFDIKDKDGKLAAKATRNLEGGIKQKLGEFITGSYAVNIIDNSSIPTIIILEFLAVLEPLMIGVGRSSPGVFGGGLEPTIDKFGGPNIKL